MKTTLGMGSGIGGMGSEGIRSAEPVLDLTVRACYLHHVDGAGARFAGKHLRLEGNYIHDVALTNLDNTDYPNGGWPTCMGTMPWVSLWSGIPGDTWADDVVIRANRVENCWGEGIGIWYGANVVAEDNVVINPWSVGIYLDNSYGVRVSRNFVHVTRGMSGSQGLGVALATEAYDSWEIASSASHDVEISNNVIVGGNGIGWFRVSSNPANTYANVSVLFNTVSATEGTALGFNEVAAEAPIPSGCVDLNMRGAEKVW